MKYHCKIMDKESKPFPWADAIGGFTCNFCGKEVETEYEESWDDCMLWIIDKEEHEFI